MMTFANEKVDSRIARIPWVYHFFSRTIDAFHSKGYLVTDYAHGTPIDRLKPETFPYLANQVSTFLDYIQLF